MPQPADDSRRKLERFIETVTGLPELYSEFDQCCDADRGLGLILLDHNRVEVRIFLPQKSILSDALIGIHDVQDDCLSDNLNCSHISSVTWSGWILFS